MRLFEILIFLNLFIALVYFFSGKKPRFFSISSAASAVIFVTFHLTIEGARWQMFPAYLFTLVIFLIFLKNIFFPTTTGNPFPSVKRRVKRYAGIVFSFLLLIIALIPPVIFPVFKIIEPTGSRAVGTTSIFLRDHSRLDEFSKEPGDYREISARVWYPAMAGKKSRDCLI